MEGRRAARPAAPEAPSTPAGDPSAAIVEALAEAILLFDPDGAVEWCNAFAEFTFVRSRVLQGTPCNLIVCDKAEPCSDCPVAAFARRERNPGAVRVRRHIYTSERELHPFEVTLRRLPGPPRATRTMAFFRDIAEESASEGAIRARLLRGNLLVEVSDQLLSANTLQEALLRFGQRISNSLELSTVAVLLRATAGSFVPLLVLHAGVPVTPPTARIPAGSSGLRDAISTVRPQLVSDVGGSAGASGLASALEHDHVAGSSSMVVAPLPGRRGETLGVLIAGRAEVDAFEAEEVELLAGLATRLGFACESALQAQANERVVRLQQTIISQGQQITRRLDDYLEATRHYLETLSQGTGAPVTAALFVDPRDRSLRIVHIYSREAGHIDEPSSPQPLAQCHLFAQHMGEAQPRVIDAGGLLKAERSDPLLRRLQEETGDCNLALIPAGGDPWLTGCIVLAAPDPFWLSTPAELELLRGLTQQTQLSLTSVAAEGRMAELADSLRRKPAGPA